MANRPQRLDSKVLTISDLKAQADKKLPRTISEYFNHGAGDMITLNENEVAFDRYKMRPRILQNVDSIDTSTTIFGVKLQTAFPLGFPPCAAHKLAHADGESSVSRAAAKNGISMCLSSWATTALEEVAQNGGNNPYIIQVSLLKDKAVAQRIIKRAEAAGYKAIFLTVDLPVLGNRLNEARNNFSYPPELEFPNLKPGPQDEAVPAVENGSDYDRTIEWATVVPRLRQQSRMEIWLKGVYTAEDVLLAIRHELDGVVISNHGGRQLDGVPSTLDALRECAPAAAGKIGIAIDGGIRRGSDIFKALALGAQHCFVGRIPIWGLVYKGEAGVDLAVKILMQEFRATMALTGCKSVSEINRSHLSLLGSDGILAKL
ncbi:(S)-2-hydroxy-acid oxidase [Neofusicoccum parvum]|nr:(S)-2-hydroxy-acid oxidase [Neofusicoccum parvum]